MNVEHSCRQVAELLTRQQDEPLGSADSERLRIHLAICKNCENVSDQLDQLRALTQGIFDEGDSGAMQAAASGRC